MGVIAERTLMSDLGEWATFPHSGFVRYKPLFNVAGREAANPLLSPTEDARPSNGDGKQNLQADEGNSNVQLSNFRLQQGTIF